MKTPYIKHTFGTEVDAKLRSRRGWLTAGVASSITWPSLVVRQRGSHIRLQKTTPEETLKIIVPAHRPIKRSTLSHILKHAKMTAEELNKLL
jgi:hypothetical protein